MTNLHEMDLFQMKWKVCVKGDYINLMYLFLTKYKTWN